MRSFIFESQTMRIGRVYHRPTQPIHNPVERILQNHLYYEEALFEVSETVFYKNCKNGSGTNTVIN